MENHVSLDSLDARLKIAGVDRREFEKLIKEIKSALNILHPKIIGNIDPGDYIFYGPNAWPEKRASG